MGDSAQHYFEAFETVATLEETDTAAAVDLSRKIALEARQKGDEGYALFFEGEACCLEGNLVQGEGLFKKGLPLMPPADYAFANYGVVLSILGRVREAIKALDQALALNSRNVLALAQKGVCLSKLLLDDLAIQCFDHVLDLEPDNAHAIRNKGVSLSRLRREEEALVYFDKALQINPMDQHALSEKKILLDEMRLKGTPLGWLIIWFRKVLTPAIKRMFLKRY